MKLKFRYTAILYVLLLTVLIACSDTQDNSSSTKDEEHPQNESKEENTIHSSIYIHDTDNYALSKRSSGDYSLHINEEILIELFLSKENILSPKEKKYVLDESLAQKIQVNYVIIKKVNPRLCRGTPRV